MDRILEMLMILMLLALVMATSTRVDLLEARVEIQKIRAQEIEDYIGLKRDENAQVVREQ